MPNSVKTVSPKVSAIDAAIQSLQYVDDRRCGRVKSLQTKFQRLNNYLLGGIENNTILCLSALSGAGKSTLSKCIRDSINSLNPEIAFNQYVFNFEMLSFQQISRSIVSESGLPLKKLYSVEEPLNEEDYANVLQHYEEMKKRDNIWFIEVPGTADTIANSIMHYYKTECKPNNKTLIYEIDHALLTKGRQGASEKERVDELMYNLVQVKKLIAADGGNSIGIILSQMNREIRDKERLKNPELHRPSTDCLFGASSIEQCADYVLFSHIPAKLGLNSYTQENYPTRVKIGDRYMQMAYFELVKQRSGESDLTIPMWNNLHKFDFEEMPLTIFYELVTEFRLRGECEYLIK